MKTPTKQSYFDQIDAIIHEHGWMAQGVGGNHFYIYTIGLTTTLNHPELVICGASQHMMHGVLSHLINDIRLTKTPLLVNLPIDHLFNHPVLLQEVPKSVKESHLGLGVSYLQNRAGTPTEAIKVYQVFWSDEKGIFEWESGFNPALRGLQHLPSA